MKLSQAVTLDGKGAVSLKKVRQPLIYTKTSVLIEHLKSYKNTRNGADDRDRTCTPKAQEPKSCTSASSATSANIKLKVENGKLYCLEDFTMLTNIFPNSTQLAKVKEFSSFVR